MNRVGFLRATRAIAAKDLRLEWRTLETLSTSVVFSLIVLLIFNFAFSFSTIKQLGPAKLVPGVLWTVLAFGAVVTMTRSMQIERQRDTLGAVFMAPVDRGALFTGKFLANMVKLTLLQWIVTPLSAVFFDYDLFSIAGPMMLVLLLHAIGLTELGTLFAGVATRVGRGEALLATLLFPAVAPLFISAVKCTSALLAGEGLVGAARTWLLITLGFDLLYFFVAQLTFEFVLEE